MWCNNCNIPLSLEYVIEKNQRGLGNDYTVKCCKCPFTRVVHTNSLFGNSKEYVSVNAKAAIGKLSYHLLILEYLHLFFIIIIIIIFFIAPVSSNLFKRYERVVGEKIEEVALESCSSSLAEEKSLTKAANDVVVDE